MQNWVKIAAAVGILLLAGVVYYMRSDNRPNDVGQRTTFEVQTRCRSCNGDAQIKVDVKDDMPYECDKCGKQTAWPLWKCGSCGEVFLPELAGNPPRPPAMPPCPKCKSVATGGLPPA